MTPPDLLTPDELAELRRFPSPTVANALERFRLRGRCEGVTHIGVQCHYPELGPVVAYAVTLTVRSAPPPAGSKIPSRKPYWDHVLTGPAPTPSPARVDPTARRSLPAPRARR